MPKEKFNKNGQNLRGALAKYKNNRQFVIQFYRSMDSNQLTETRQINDRINLFLSDATVEEHLFGSQTVLTLKQSDDYFEQKNPVENSGI